MAFWNGRRRADGSDTGSTRSDGSTSPWPGQAWSYVHRPGDDGSYCVVLAVEPVDGPAGVFVHLAVERVWLPTSPEAASRLTRIAHLPVTRTAFENSVLGLRHASVPIPDFGASYEQWRAARGGAFTISIGAAVESVETTIRHGSPG